MKIKVTISNALNHILFQGNPINLPVKEEDIKRVSLEMFRDPDPCIIHQSYAVQKLIEEMLNHFGKQSLSKIPLSKHLEATRFLKFDHLEDLYLTLEVK
jgi:hypothetical protein